VGSFRTDAVPEEVDVGPDVIGAPAGAPSPLPCNSFNPLARSLPPTSRQTNDNHKLHQSQPPLSAKQHGINTESSRNRHGLHHIITRVDQQTTLPSFRSHIRLAFTVIGLASTSVSPTSTTNEEPTGFWHRPSAGRTSVLVRLTSNH
jgi:hypothetical protein